MLTRLHIATKLSFLAAPFAGSSIIYPGQWVAVSAWIFDGSFKTETANIAKSRRTKSCLGVGGNWRNLITRRRNRIWTITWRQRSPGVSNRMEIGAAYIRGRVYASPGTIFSSWRARMLEFMPTPSRGVFGFRATGVWMQSARSRMLEAWKKSVWAECLRLSRERGCHSYPRFSADVSECLFGMPLHRAQEVER